MTFKGISVQLAAAVWTPSIVIFLGAYLFSKWILLGLLIPLCAHLYFRWVEKKGVGNLMEDYSKYSQQAEIYIPFPVDAERSNDHRPDTFAPRIRF